jgi:hypothetical protein
LAINEDHVRVAVGPGKDAMGVIPVLRQRFALDREHRRAAGGNRRRRVILSRINIARRPAHFGAQRVQCFDQYRGLNGHMQGSRDARSAQRLRGREFVPDGHEAGHFGFRDLDFLAAPIGQRQILHQTIGGKLDCCIHR